MNGVQSTWQRLDPRMLVVGPLGALRQFAVPMIAALVGLSSSRGSIQWWVLPAALVGALAMGIVPWLSTRYLVTDQQFLLHRGLINRRVLTAPLDRVRSVDLESSLIHRLLGLTKVKVGTGVDDDQIELNALGTQQAEQLRRTLLARRTTSAVVPADTGAEVEHAPAVEVAPEEELLATLDWSWVRFAPLSLARLAVVAGTIGVLSQFLDDLPVISPGDLRGWWEEVIAYGWVLVILGAMLGSVLLWLLLSTAGYALQWGGLRLVRDADTVRMTAGLLTTRSTTVEEARIRGVELVEPSLMRLADGAELRALATGVGSGGTAQLLPPSPMPENLRVGEALLGSAQPLTLVLTRHGARARRRRYVQFVSEALTLAVIVAVATRILDWSWWWPLVALIGSAPVLALLAELSYRNLGHALTAEHLVSGTGLLSRTRTVLERDGVIGWVIEQTFFQRRAGLATLVATTAAGSERVRIEDVGYDVAVALAAEVTPDAVTDFTSPQAPSVA